MSDLEDQQHPKTPTFTTNTLYTPQTLREFARIYAFDSHKQEMQEALAKIKALKPHLEQAIKSDNEHQLEDNFISKILEILGWQCLRQEEKVFQGKSLKPDFLLFASPSALESYQALDKAQRHENLGFSVIAESKKPSQELDTRKVQDNPHHQILNYLNTLDKKHGFLTNGKLWRFYDTHKRTKDKAYLEFDLEGILNPQLFSQQALQAFELFYHLFNAKNFAENTKEIKDTEDKAITAKREDLERVIFARTDAPPIFEQIGVALYQRNPTATPQEIFENTLYFIFRLLFIGYFEDKYETMLKAKRKDFKKYLSLERILQLSADQDPESFSGMGALEDLFKIYNEGNRNYKMPVFNGGLFEPSKTALFEVGQILSDQELHQILAQLLYFGDAKRDYTNLGVAQLGRVYEKLLEFKFAIAIQDTYLSTEQNATFTPTKPTRGKFATYKKGDLYFKNNNNSRKASGSYYTPQDITRHLVKKALEDLTPENLNGFKILDNACGSGAFLVEGLHQVSQKALGFLRALKKKKGDSKEEDIEDIVLSPEAKKQLEAFERDFEAERENITKETQKYLKDHTPDEYEVLRRFLLKKMIYGVDKNPFSVELAKLSLWIDSFIFGTPLSFLEHHIKCGDALMGASLKEFEAWYKQQAQGLLFTQNLQGDLEDLQKSFSTLANTPDTTAPDIEKSKHLYYHQITPKLERLKLFLDYYTADNLIKSSAFKDPQVPKDPKALQEWRKTKQGLESLDCNEWRETGEGLASLDLEMLLAPSERTKPELQKQDDPYAKVRHKVQALAHEFRFFHYDLEFADCTDQQGNFQGFHAITTNPPWEKTKFDEAQFFAPLIENYRRLSPQEKRLAQENAFFADKSLESELTKEQAHAKTLTEHYKARYPLNKGAGDSNLFRFFVERNLGLLSGRLCLVVPSALMFEEGSLALREHLLTQHSLESFESFENRQKIFKGVHSCFKFALVCIHAKPNHYPTIEGTKDQPCIHARFYATSLEDLKPPALQVPLASVLNSPKKSLKEIRTPLDLEILNTLESKANGFARLNPQWLDFRRELDMTNDSDLFTPIGQVWATHPHTGMPYEITPKKARGSKTKASPSQTPPPEPKPETFLLLEGKHMHQFNAEFAPPPLRGAKGCPRRAFSEQRIKPSPKGGLHRHTHPRAPLF